MCAPASPTQKGKVERSVAPKQVSEQIAIIYDS